MKRELIDASTYAIEYSNASTKYLIDVRGYQCARYNSIRYGFGIAAPDMLTAAAWAVIEIFDQTNHRGRCRWKQNRIKRYKFYVVEDSPEALLIHVKNEYCRIRIEPY